MDTMGLTFFFQWEVQFQQWLQSVMPPFLLSICKFISTLGGEKPMIAILGLIYWGVNKELGKKVGVSMGLASLLGSGIKNFFDRRRPYFDHDGILCLHKPESSAHEMDMAAQGFSFPSLHATHAVASIGAIPAFYKGKGRKVLILLAVLWPLLVGFSRVAVGVHYVTDVFAGWVIGLLCLFLTGIFTKTRKRRNILLITLSVLGLGGFFVCDTSDYFTSYGIFVAMCCAFPFEERFVNFESTTNWLQVLIRVVGGVAVFLAIAEGIKLLIPADIRNAADTVAFIIRAARYFLASFVSMGIYPMLFKYIAKINLKKNSCDKA